MTIQELIKTGALFVCNHSGGKDSQAMYLYLKSQIPAQQLIVIHAHLQGVEWEGTIDHIKNTIDHHLYVVQAKKTFFDMVEKRGMFPSPKNRQCTSDLKRDPIKKQIVALSNQNRYKLIVNCMGLRAEESSARAKKEVFKLNKRNTNGKRTWYDWLPIHDWTTEEVFDEIFDNGQQPHWAYKEGMSRLSCCFCIMASEEDLRLSAKLNPKLAEKYIDTEDRLGHTLLMPKKGIKRTLGSVLSSPCMQAKNPNNVRALDTK